MSILGGPGMPSSGYGNFLEIGPLTMNLTERNHTWVKHFNVLFIDNPVGVGFSYFSNNCTAMAENNEEIGRDLISFLKQFLNRFTKFQDIPIYIFGESYGGKMAVEFARQLSQVSLSCLTFLNGHHQFLGNSKGNRQGPN